MTELDFGEVVNALVEEICNTECSLTREEQKNTGLAREHYIVAVINRLRQVFDKAGRGES
jgi:DNA-binding IscR family transcriptional regulator